MTNKLKRKSSPATEKSDYVAKVVTSDTLESSGKLNPASIDGSGILDEDEEKNTKIFIPILKSDNRKNIVTGVVLQPEVVDAQGDIYSADVVEKAAHQFLSKYNKATQLGLQHTTFGKYKFELYESWLAPHDVVINNTTIKSGSWIMSVWVGDQKIQKMVNEGKIKGFSIGGRAKIKKLENDDVS